MPAKKTTPLRLVLTQRADLAAPLAAALRARGARPLQVPVTRWLPPPNPARYDAALAKAHARAYDWILFSNPHTVHYFFKRYRELFGNVRGLAGGRMGAYGPMTGKALRAMRVKPAAVAADHKTKLILEAVKPVKGQRFLVIRGDSKHATENVPQALKKLGACVDVLQGYAVEVDTRDLTGAAADMLQNGADWLVFSSALAIQHFNRRFNTRSLLRRFPNLRVAVTNITLCPALKKTGIPIPPPVIARPNDPRDLLKKILARRM